MSSQDEELIGLIARAALKDENAFEALYKRVGAYLNGVALRIVKSPEASNEVLQEAFIQIWQNASSYRPHLAKPLTWLTSIVRYRALDRLDKDQRLARREIAPDDMPEQRDRGLGPELAMDQRQHLRHIVACMEQLTDKAKRAMTLAYVYGYSREEISEQLSANTSTVKSWLRRGAEKLRQCLKQRMIEEP